MWLGNSVSIDYFFLCCLTHRDFGKDCLDLPRVIGYLLSRYVGNFYQGFGSKPKGRVLW